MRPDAVRPRGVVGVGEVVARLLLRDRLLRGLDDGVQLVLQGDVVNGVVHHVHRVGVALRGRELERALGVRQAIQLVVGEALAGRSAENVGRGHRDVVRKAQDVPHLVVAVGEVLEERAVVLLRGQTVEPPCLGIVAVGGLDAVALLDEDALLELVIEQAPQVRAPSASIYTRAPKGQMRITIAAL